MSTGSDNNSKSRTSTPVEQHGPTESRLSSHHPDDFVDSCSCTDVTLDEHIRINHNHRKSMARKKKLQTQRLKELHKTEVIAEAAAATVRNDNESQQQQLPKSKKAIKVSYLGSITLATKSSDLSALQKPLKSLYFKHVISEQTGISSVPGSLEITKTGLKVKIFLC
jgi:hypothetical protein